MAHIPAAIATMSVITGHFIQIGQAYVHKVCISLVCCSCRYKPFGPFLGQHSCSPGNDEFNNVRNGYADGEYKVTMAMQIGRRAERNAKTKTRGVISTTSMCRSIVQISNHDIYYSSSHSPVLVFYVRLFAFPVHFLQVKC